MSWGIPQVTATGDSIVEALKVASEDYLDSGVFTDEVADQVSACISAAALIISSGAIGSGKVSVSMSGHANPDHEPTAGWANDVIALTISNADDVPLTGGDDG